jgi:hypothetical protein
MLAQDMLTGRLHEVPDQMASTDEWPNPQLYGLGEVHDGYGNSLGLFFLPKLIQKAVGAITGGGQRAAASPAPSGCPPCPVCQTPQPYPMPPAPTPPAFAPGYPYPMRRRRRRG